MHQQSQTVAVVGIGKRNVVLRVQLRGALEQFTAAVARAAHVDDLMMDCAQSAPPGTVLIIQCTELCGAADVRVVAPVTPSRIGLEHVAHLRLVSGWIHVRIARVGARVDMGEGHRFGAGAQNAVG